jgi:hypothetical protein
MSDRKPKLSERIHDTFERYGVSKGDVVTAALSLKGLTWVTYFGTLALCYRYKPLKRIASVPSVKVRLDGIQQNYPLYGKIKNFILEKSQKLAKSRFFEPIPRTLGLKSKRFAVALAENIVVTKLLLPVTLPLQFWLVVQYFKRRKSKHNQTDDLQTVSNKQ